MNHKYMNILFNITSNNIQFCHFYSDIIGFTPFRISNAQWQQLPHSLTPLKGAF
jgi:hypothetical protein